MRLALAIALVALPAAALAAETAEDRYGPVEPAQSTPAYPGEGAAPRAAATVVASAEPYRGRFLTWASKDGLRGPAASPVAQPQPAPPIRREPAPAPAAPVALRGPEPLPQTLYDRVERHPLAAASAPAAAPQYAAARAPAPPSAP
ncbi:MAG TPA: hypothetical protein VG939_22715, partial [Caulobacteraceae bacterium]|nr:hypothetical protein [Caulobacteraceae bacterium]